MMSDSASATRPVDSPLDPNRPTGEGVLSILRQQLAALEAQEAGTRAGLDPECLHDFRVAVRRTRSALGQLKASLPAAALKKFRPEFAWLGELTSPTRDLDVYLLKFPGYRDSLPAEVRDDLEPLHRFLQAHRSLAQAKLVEGLDSERFRRLKSQWRAVLDTPEDGCSPPNARRPLREVADGQLCKALHKAFREGAAITDRSPAAELHELRKTCKKLRYLLEFFQNLYPRQQLGKLIATLKGLQDNLGDFQDLQVQSEALRTFSAQMLEEGEVPPQTLLALGMLVEALRGRQRQARKEFAKRFAGFAKAENRRLLDRLQARKSLAATLNAAKERIDGKLSEG